MIMQALMTQWLRPSQNSWDTSLAQQTEFDVSPTLLISSSSSSYTNLMHQRRQQLQLMLRAWPIVRNIYYLSWKYVTDQYLNRCSRGGRWTYPRFWGETGHGQWQWQGGGCRPTRWFTWGGEADGRGYQMSETEGSAHLSCVVEGKCWFVRSISFLSSKCHSAPETCLYHQESIDTHSIQIEANAHQTCRQY